MSFDMAASTTCWPSSSGSMLRSASKSKSAYTPACSGQLHGLSLAPIRLAATAQIARAWSALHISSWSNADVFHQARCPANFPGPRQAEHDHAKWGAADKTCIQARMLRQLPARGPCGQRAPAARLRSIVEAICARRTPIVVHVQDTAGVGLHNRPGVGVVRGLEPSAPPPPASSRRPQAAQPVSKSSATVCRCARRR